MTYVQPHLITSHAPLIGAPSPRPRQQTPQTDSDYKVTGTSIFDRPDQESQWDPGNGGRWIRKWLPGEKEAEAARRMGEVQNDLYEQRELTAQGRKERAALVGEVTEAIKQGRFSSEELPRLMQEFGIAEDTIRMADALREREPTAQESFAKNTFTDKDGVIFSRDGKMLYNPNDARMKYAEYEAKRLDALKARADKFELELRKPFKAGMDKLGKDEIKMRSEDEIESLMKKHFPDLYPSTPAPAPAVAAPVGGDDEFEQFRRQ